MPLGDAEAKSHRFVQALAELLLGHQPVHHDLEVLVVREFRKLRRPCGRTGTHETPAHPLLGRDRPARHQDLQTRPFAGSQEMTGDLVGQPSPQRLTAGGRYRMSTCHKQATQHEIKPRQINRTAKASGGLGTLL